MSLQVDLTARRERNLKVLQSIDSAVVEIIEDYSYAAVYQFDAISMKWEKLDVEGSAFITRSHHSIPFQYSFIVLNKKGPTDFVLDLGTMQKLKAQHPYIMVRCTTNAAPATFGLWLHSSVERNALLNLIERIVFKNEMPQSPSAKAVAKANLLKSVLKFNGTAQVSPAAADTSIQTQGNSHSAPDGGGSTSASKKSKSSKKQQQQQQSQEQQPSGSVTKSEALMSLIKPQQNHVQQQQLLTSSGGMDVDAAGDSGDSVAKTNKLLSLMKIKPAGAESFSEQSQQQLQSQSQQQSQQLGQGQNGNESNSATKNKKKKRQKEQQQHQLQESAPEPPQPAALAAPSVSDSKSTALLALMKGKGSSAAAAGGSDFPIDSEIAARLRSTTANAGKQSASVPVPVAATVTAVGAPSSVLGGPTAVKTSAAAKENLLKNILLEKPPAAAAVALAVPPPSSPIVPPAAARAPSNVSPMPPAVSTGPFASNATVESASAKAKLISPSDLLTKKV